MITIDFHAFAGKAVVAKFQGFCTLKLSEGGDTINMFFEPQDFDKAQQIATLINEAFENRRTYAENGFIRPDALDAPRSFSSIAAE